MSNPQPPSPADRYVHDHQAALTESLAVFMAAAERFPARLRNDRPREGAFSATEIVYHMLAVEHLWQDRIDKLLTGGSREFQALDPDEDAAMHRYNERDYNTGLEELTKSRIDTLATIARLSLEQFSLYGIHSKYGEMTIHAMLETMERHDRQHAAQLDRTATELMNVTEAR